MRTADSISKILLPRLAFLPVSVILLSVGCQTGNQGTPGILGIPAENRAKVLSRDQGGPKGERRWKWSLIGERTWMNVANQEGAISLEKTIPLNDANMKGGTNIWETDLTVTETASGLRWKSRIHGSNGKTAESEGMTAGKLTDVEILLARDGEVSLPADMALARIADRKITWHLAK